MVMQRAMRFATVAALAAAAVGLPSAASADSALPAYNVTQPIGVPNASAVAVDSATHRVYVASQVNRSVAVLDGLTRSTLATITVPYAPTSVGIDSASHRLFILGDVTTRNPLTFTISLSIVDTTTNAIITTVPGPAWPGALAVDTVNHRVLAASWAFDETGKNLTRSAPPEPFSVAIDPSGHRLYSTTTTGTVAVWDTTTYMQVATVRVAGSPPALAVDPATHSVYVSDLNHAVVSVINGTTDKVTATIPVGGAPTAVAVDSTAGSCRASDSRHLLRRMSRSLQLRAVGRRGLVRAGRGRR